jgi:O-antigen/teichoic acid export membrane protein
MTTTAAIAEPKTAAETCATTGAEKQHEPIKKARTGFLAAVMALGGATALAQALGILTAPVLSRLFLPEAFGLAALYLALPALTSCMGCMRYEDSIMLPDDEKDAANLFSLSFILIMVNTAIMVSIVLISGNVILRLLNAPQLGKFIWLWPISFFLLAVAPPMRQWNARQNRFKYLGATNLAKSSAGKFIKITGGSLGFNGGGNLILFDMACQVVSSAMLTLRILKSDIRYVLSSISLRRMFQLAARYRRFPLYMSWSMLLNQAFRYMPLILLGYFFGSAVVGLYSFALVLLQLPLAVVGEAVGQVLFQRTASCHARRQDLGPLVVGVFQPLAALGLFPAAVLMVLGPEIFGLLLGAKWIEAGVYTSILAPWLVVMLVYSPMTVLFVVFEKQRKFLVFNLLLFATSGASLLTAGFLFESARWAIAGLSVTSSLVCLAAIVSVLRMVRTSIVEVLKPLLLLTICAGLGLGLLAAGKWLLQLHTVWLLIAAVLFCGLYYCLAFWRVPVLREKLIGTIGLANKKHQSKPDTFDSFV